MIIYTAPHSNALEIEAEFVPHLQFTSSHASTSAIELWMLREEAQGDGKTGWNSEVNSLAERTKIISSYTHFLVPCLAQRQQWKPTDVIHTAPLSLCNRKALYYYGNFAQGEFFFSSSSSRSPGYAYRVLFSSIAIYITSFLRSVCTLTLRTKSLSLSLWCSSLSVNFKIQGGFAVMQILLFQI